MNGKHIGFGLIVLALPLCSHLSLSQDEALFQSYINLSTEDHYLAADIKLEKMLLSPDPSMVSEKLENLKDTQKLLWDAVRQFKFFDTGNEVFLSDNWRSGMNRIFEPDALDPAQSPLSLLAHLFLARDSGQQTASQIMVQPVQYSEESVRRHDALDEANDLVHKSLEAAQKVVDKVVYSSGTYRFFIEIPSSYQTMSTNNRMPVSTSKKFPDGATQRAVVVNILQAEHTIAPEDHVNARIAERRKKFTGLSDFVIEEARGDGYRVRALFGYTYTWDGKKVKSLCFHHKNGQTALEVSCAALADHFDREEFDSIIRSFHKY